MHGRYIWIYDTFAAGACVSVQSVERILFTSESDVDAINTYKAECYWTQLSKCAIAMLKKIPLSVVGMILYVMYKLTEWTTCVHYKCKLFLDVGVGELQKALVGFARGGMMMIMLVKSMSILHGRLR